MNNPLLSICISSYNRGKRCRFLIDKLLNIDGINVFVSDDCSGNEELAYFQGINDSRVVVIKHDYNLGACRNWYETLKAGNGKYVLHILDRDDVNIEMIRYLIICLRKYDVGGGYMESIPTIHRSENWKQEDGVRYCIFEHGKEALAHLGGIPFHPTGFFIKRELLHDDRFRNYFYINDVYGVYPHSYVMAWLALDNKLLYFKQKFYKSDYKGNTAKSRFYSKTPQIEYWWLPKEVYRNCLTTLNELIDGIDEKELQYCLIVERIKDCFYKSTIGYKHTVLSTSEMNHYQQSIEYIYKYQMMRILFVQIFKFSKWSFEKKVVDIKMIRTFFKIIQKQCQIIIED